jgi:hypothetical protein
MNRIETGMTNTQGQPFCILSNVKANLPRGRDAKLQGLLRQPATERRVIKEEVNQEPLLVFVFCLQ